jgi:hypothetical protein
VPRAVENCTLRFSTLRSGSLDTLGHLGYEPLLERLGLRHPESPDAAAELRVERLTRFHHLELLVFAYFAAASF